MGDLEGVRKSLDEMKRKLCSTCEIINVDEWTVNAKKSK